MMSLASLEHQEVERFTGEFVLFTRVMPVAWSFLTPTCQAGRARRPDPRPRRVRAVLAAGHQPGPGQRTRVRTIPVDEAISSGDLGYAVGAVVDLNGRELSTKDATIGQCDADGRWRLAVDCPGPIPRPGC